MVETFPITDAVQEGLSSPVHPDYVEKGWDGEVDHLGANFYEGLSAVRAILDNTYAAENPDVTLMPANIIDSNNPYYVFTAVGMVNFQPLGRDIAVDTIHRFIQSAIQSQFLNNNELLKHELFACAIEGKTLADELIKPVWTKELETDFEGDEVGFDKFISAVQSDLITWTKAPRARFSKTKKWIETHLPEKKLELDLV